MTIGHLTKKAAVVAAFFVPGQLWRMEMVFNFAPPEPHNHKGFCFYKHFIPSATKDRASENPIVLFVARTLETPD